MTLEGPPILYTGWPVHERTRLFEQGCIIASPDRELADATARDVLGHRSAGWWECDLLAGNALTWTSGVYAIFGLPPGSQVTRDEAVALYCEEARLRMERLRAYAIAHGSGFVLDAQIRPASGGSETRWMRLIGNSDIANGRVTMLHGLKLLI